MLKVIATFILIYLLFRVLTMWVFPLIGRWYLDRYKKRFYRENPWAADAAARQRGATGRQGETKGYGMHPGGQGEARGHDMYSGRKGGAQHSDRHPGGRGSGRKQGSRRPANDSDKLGEYVDFEEIDD